MQYTLSPQEREERRLKQAERDAAMRLKNNRLGITVFQGSWIMIFICLVVVYAQMGYSPDWFQAGYSEPSALLPTIATVALIASTLLARNALKAVEQDQVQTFMAQWLIAIILAIAFMGIMAQQFFAVPLEAGQFAFAYRLMIGYHGAHAVVIAYMMFQVYRYGMRRMYHAGNTWAVEATTRLWYFVTAAWLLFYVVLYII